MRSLACLLLVVALIAPQAALALDPGKVPPITLGTGSSGDASAVNVTPSALAAPGTLARSLADQAASLAAKAPLTSPSFSGTITTPVLALTGAGSTGPIDGMTVGGFRLDDSLTARAPLASPTFTGTTTIPKLALTGSASTGEVSNMSAMVRGTLQGLGTVLSNRVPNWTEFGTGACQGNAAADTAAFQAAVAEGGRFTLYCSQNILLNDGAVATKWINIDADNNAASINLTPLFPQTSDVLTLRPAVTAGNFYGWRVAGLKINAVVNGRGRHAITIDTSAGGGMSLTGLTIERNQVGDVQGSAAGFQNMGGAAIRFIGNATQADQFFVSNISRNYLTGGAGFTDAQGNAVPGGGIYMRKAGDSLHIDENWIKGPGRAIDVEFIAGAANYTIQRNNLTSSGGAVKLRYGLRGAIEDNQIELLTAWTGDADRALIVINDSDGTTIDKNNINADLGDHSANLVADAISLLGTTARTDIRSGNRLVVNFQTASSVHLRTASTVTATTFWPGQRIENPFLTISTRQADVLATAIGTPGSVRGIWFSAPLANGWTGQSTGGVTYEGLFYKINPDGHVSLRGNLTPGTLTAGTSIATLPDEARPAKTMRLFPKQAQSASSYLPLGLQVSNGGSITATYAVPSTLPVSFDDVSYNPTAN